MGIEGYYMNIFVVLMALYAFSLLFTDAAIGSGNPNYASYPGFSKTLQYQQSLQNSTQNFQNNIAASASQNAPGIVEFVSSTASLILNSFGFAITSLFSTFTIGISLLGDMSGLGFIPTFFISIAITALIMKFLLDSLAAIRLGQTK